jgi:hypothetical protein
METYKQDSLSSIDLQMDEEVKQQLMESAKWTKFISVVVFSLSGLMLVGGIWGASYFLIALERVGYMSPQLAGLAGYGVGYIIGIIVIIVAFLVITYYFMFRFATKIKTGILTEDSKSVSTSFSSLKIYTIITSILSILFLLISIFNLFK